VLGACRAGSSQAPEGLGTCIASTSPILSFVCIHLYTARLGPPGALGIRLGEMSCIPLIDQDDHLPQLISSGCTRSFFVRTVFIVVRVCWWIEAPLFDHS
jgi:hypothetical protein